MVNRIPGKLPGARALLNGSSGILRVLKRRKRLVFITAGAAFLLAAFACLLTTKQYTATCFIEIREAFPANPGAAAPPAGKTASAAAVLQVDIQKQIDILQSEPLATRVMQELNLGSSEDLRARAGLMGWAKAFVSKRSHPPAAPDNDASERQASWLGAFHRRLLVQAVPQTRLVSISYRSDDPGVAANVANHLVNGLIAYNSDPRLSSSNPVSQRLEEQLNDFRQRNEELQNKVEQLQRSEDDNRANGQDAGSPVLGNLEKSAAALSQAIMNRILKQAAYDVAKSGDPQTIAQLSGPAANSADASSPGAAHSSAMIQSLLSQEVALKSQIEQESARFAPSYPPLVRDKAALRTTLQSLQEETARVEVQTRTDYDQAVQTEEAARAAYDGTRAEASKTKSPGIEDAILKQEAEQSQKLYQQLLKRLRQQDIATALPTATIAVVDAATPPERPSAPNVPLYLLSGLAGGLLIGGSASLMVEARNKTVNPSMKARR